VVISPSNLCVRSAAASPIRSESTVRDCRLISRESSDFASFSTLLPFPVRDTIPVHRVLPVVHHVEGGQRDIPRAPDPPRLKCEGTPRDLFRPRPDRAPVGHEEGTARGPRHRSEIARKEESDRTLPRHGCSYQATAQA